MSDVTTIGNFRDGTLVATDGSTLSATLALYDGAYSIDNLVPDGAEVEVYQAQGHVVGARKGARVFPTIGINGHLNTPLDAFRKLVGVSTDHDHWWNGRRPRNTRAIVGVGSDACRSHSGATRNP